MEARERKLSNVTPRLPLIGTPVLSRTTSAKPGGHMVSVEEANILHDLSHVDTELLEELPAFERHEESTVIELFYDLFFVANLTTFSDLHEINTFGTLQAYVGFFCILWFTWCLTSLYDIRFVSDSLVSRVSKGVHLGIMVGLAVSGPKFDTTDHVSELRVMGMNLGFLHSNLGANVLASNNSDGLKNRPWPSILFSPVPRSPLQTHQTPPKYNRRFLFPYSFYLFRDKLASSFLLCNSKTC
jgi:hypothetical protein